MAQVLANVINAIDKGFNSAEDFVGRATGDVGKSFFGAATATLNPKNYLNPGKMLNKTVFDPLKTTVGEVTGATEARKQAKEATDAQSARQSQLIQEQKNRQLQEQANADNLNRTRAIRATRALSGGQAASRRSTILTGPLGAGAAGFKTYLGQ